MFDDIIESIAKKLKVTPDGKEKIAKVLNGETVDCLPLIFWKPQNTTILGKTYNMKEQFYSKEKMLYAHLEEIECCACCTFDALLCLRPNFGTVFIPAMFGLKYQVFEDKYPWLVSHLTKQDIVKFEFPDLDKNEMMCKALEYIRFFKENLPEWIHVYLPDTQGPFDIAHMVYGDDIFLELYDDPQFVHDLMEICTQMYIQVSIKLKEAIGEALNECYHGHALVRGIYMKNGGVRISEDSATLLSPFHIDEFVVPYLKKALEPFGGGFIHYCGKNDYFLEVLLDMDEVRAINFGNPEKHDFETVMKKFLDHNKCYFGLWPKMQNETISEYIIRMKKVSDGGKRGLLLHFDESMYPDYSCEQIFTLWQSVMTSA
ncbi:hypothetical protein KVG29_03035 [Caldicoprobacter algeriensis]|uniref:uroporphyrinogen decarboxylase family protein n=1 Tax=Caldicoprobacter algeriensis TaxID=699281 RepID=UPI00207A19B9|nr:uroporphyrinogen decarboxylase family protein [Caldicoprobacter algeriensis]MCM8900199.1 hypothetical protein [Caldicoprobacter algeriensis]